MKTYIVFLFLSISSILYSQTYSFNKKETKIYVNQNNTEILKTIESRTGDYRIVFGKNGSDEYFTILNPGQNNSAGLPWFGLIEVKGFKEAHGKYFKSCTYYDTAKDSLVPVLIERNFTHIVIFSSDGTIIEFLK